MWCVGNMLDWLEAHQLPCLVRRYLGVECPGCGFQTALLLLLHGEWKAAFFAYPALYPLILFVALGLLRICGVKKISQGWLKITGFACLAAILISYLLKLTN